MKLKRLPEDFQVEELTTARPVERGRYTFYRLSKRGLGTIEAVGIICRRWNLAGRQVSYGGLKDRHAVTTQYLTIADGPARPLRETSFELEPIGALNQPYGPQLFSGNRFAIVIRDLGAERASRVIDELKTLPNDGLPNYFDDQRFGSVGRSGQFIGHAWLKGDHELALKLVLAEPNPFDAADIKAQKAIVREYWNQWTEAKNRLDRSSTRSIVTYLVDHPQDYRGAFARLKRELRSLYFSAFQSHLWNLILSQWIIRNTRPEHRVMVDLKVAPLAFPLRLNAEEKQAIASVSFPLPSSRTPMPDGPLGEVVRDVLQPFDLEWNNLRVKHLKDVFLSKGSRPALIFPRDMESTLRDDELHPRRKAIHLAFSLGKGSYATILVKRVTDVSEPPA